jgi:hypothetical protein
MHCLCVVRRNKGIGPKIYFKIKIKKKLFQGAEEKKLVFCTGHSFLFSALKTGVTNNLQ